MDGRKDAVEVDDYLLDETMPTGAVRLLDYGGGLAEDLPIHAVPLAKIAAAIHENARFLSPAQHEQAIRWLKAWKLRDVPIKTNKLVFEHQFARRLDAVKTSTAQNRLIAKAHIKSIWSRVFAALLAIAAVVVVVIYGAHSWRWYEAAGAGIVLWLFYSLSSKFNTKALQLAKEQDRRYFLDSLREGQTVSELNEAGLFAYVPDTMPEQGKTFSWVKSVLAMRRAQEQLSDALYTDPESFLVPSVLDGAREEWKGTGK